jgi:hypothetical protein
MIVDQLDIKSVTVVPTKADAKLIVHSDAVLAASVTVQGLQSITRRRPQVRQVRRRVDEQELAMCLSLNLNRKRPAALAAKDSLGIFVGERLNHGGILTHAVTMSRGKPQVDRGQPACSPPLPTARPDRTQAFLREKGDAIRERRSPAHVAGASQERRGRPRDHIKSKNMGERARATTGPTPRRWAVLGGGCLALPFEEASRHDTGARTIASGSQGNPHDWVRETRGPGRLIPDWSAA